MNNTLSDQKVATSAVSFSLVTVFCLTLVPYVQFGPLGVPSEIQPWAALAAWAMLVIQLVRGKFYISRFELAIFLFSVIFLIYFPLNQDMDVGQYLRKSIAFILSFSLMVVARYLNPLIVLKVLKPISFLWFLFAVLGEFSPQAYQEFISPLVPGALGSYGARGVTSLAPEATDFGFTMVYFWVLTMLASASARANGDSGAPLWLYGLILASIVMSRSGSGIFGLTVVLAVKAVSLNLSSHRISMLALKIIVFCLAIFFFASAIANLVPDTGIRGVDLLISAVQSPSNLVDTTLSYRVAHNLVGLYGMLDSNFLGHGAGTFTVLGTGVYHEYFIGDIIGVQGWFRRNIPVTLSDSALAIFPVILFEYGLLGLVFLVYLFGTVLTSLVRFRGVIFSLLFMTWAQSFPVAFPLFWLLLGLVQNKSFSTKSGFDW